MGQIVDDGVALGGAELDDEKDNEMISSKKRFGLKAKILGLLSVLAVVSVVSILFIDYEVFKSKTAIDAQRANLNEMYSAQYALSSFSDVKYWYTEMAVSLSEEAAISSEQSAELFVEQINKITSIDDDVKAEIFADLDALITEAEDALMSYTFGENKAGQESMASVRDYIAFIDDKLVTLMNNVRSQAEASVVVVEKSSNIALVGGIIALGLVSLIVLLLFIAMSRMILKPLVRITDEMMQLAQGNTDLKLIDTKKTDEVGDMARAVQIFCQNSLEIVALNKEQELANKERQEEREAAELVEQNKRKEREKRQREEIEAKLVQQRNDIKTLLEDKLFATLALVISAAEDMEQSAMSLSVTVEQSSGEARSLSQTSIKTASDANSVASATVELSASINEISSQAEDSSQMSNKAVVMQQKANEAVNELNEMSSHIADILNLINEIAEKTNLLALNATIEAARAGEAGKGFAVVASEVKSLAHQTSQATGEIKSQIENIQQSSSETVEAINAIGSSITAISDSTGTIAGSVTEQRSATEEISTLIRQAVDGNNNITLGVERISEGISETDVASTKVREVSTQILDIVSNLRNEVDGFLVSLASDQVEVAEDDDIVETEELISKAS